MISTLTQEARNKISRRAYLVLTLCSFSMLVLTPFAFASELTDNLAETDRKLVLELASFAEYNVNYQLEANRHQPWRALTYPIGREAGTAASFAATMVDLNQQARGLNNPRRINRHTLKKAVRCGITGSAISGGASALELAQNTWVMLKAREQGFSPRTAIDFVKGVMSKTETLISQREQIGEQLAPEKREAVKAETELIRRIRQQLLSEFGMWSCHSVDQAWRENTFFAIDSAQNFTRMGAGILALKAFKNPRLARSSVICAMISACAATVNPVVRNVVGIAVGKHHERTLAKEFSLDRPTPAVAETDTITASHAGLSKLISLSHRSARMDAELDRETQLIERYRQIAQQQSVSGPLIGLAGVTAATLATVAVYGHRTHPETAIQLGFSGRICQATGQGYALLNTPYTAIKGAMRKQALAKKGLLPRQILQERLKRLEELKAANK